MLTYYSPKMKNTFSLIVSILISLFGITRGIILGVDVPMKQYPYQVSVYVNGEHICGGVIIDDSTILTAAHCIRFNDPSYVYKIRVGSKRHSKGKEYKLGEIIIHEQFNKTARNDLDIAILKLPSSSYLKFNSKIYPIPLQEQYNEVQPDTICRVSGWGMTGQERVSTYLKAAEVSIVTNQECNIYYRAYYTSKGYGLQNVITSNMICARSLRCPIQDYRMQHTFKGDSGGPLVCNGKLVGIVSFGVPYVCPDCPRVFTKISELHNWIIQNKQPNYCSLNDKAQETNDNKNIKNSFVVNLFTAAGKTFLNYYADLFSNLK